MTDSIKLMRAAIIRGDADAVEDLLQKGIEIEARDVKSGETFLYLAAKVENEKIFDLLLQAGADVNSKNNNGETPLHALAIHSEHERGPLCSRFEPLVGVKMATKLLSLGADVNARQFEQRTPLDCAASRGKVDLVKLLLRNGADVNVVNAFNDDPLSNALLETRDGEYLAEIVQILVDYGSPANRYDEVSRTCPLDLACVWGKEIVKTLLENGANPNVNVGEDGYSLLLRQMHSNPKAEVIRTLLKYGADVNFVTEDVEETVLDDDNHETCEVVLEHIALLQALKLNVHPALYRAIRENYCYKRYFLKCKRELAEAKEDTLIEESKVSCFNLLVDSKEKLLRYADNEAFVVEFEECYIPDIYPIYGEILNRRFDRAIQKRRETFDKAVETLSYFCPVLESSPSIVKDILYCLSIKQLETNLIS